MASTTDSLSTLLAFDGSHLTDDQAEAIGASSGMKQLRSRVASALLPSLWPGALRSIGAEIAAALDIRLADVLVAGWNKYRELTKLADRKRHPPDEVNLVALGEHEIKSVHEPRVAITIDGVSFAEIRFRIDLAAKLETATLKVQDARIREVSTGRCTVKAALSCEGLKLVEEQHAVTLPGTVSFDGGIPIGDREQGNAQESNLPLAESSG